MLQRRNYNESIKRQLRCNWAESSATTAASSPVNVVSDLLADDCGAVTARSPITCSPDHTTHPHTQRSNGHCPCERRLDKCIFLHLFRKLTFKPWQAPAFYRPDIFQFSQPTVLQHWRKLTELMPTCCMNPATQTQEHVTQNNFNHPNHHFQSTRKPGYQWLCFWWQSITQLCYSLQKMWS